MGISREYKKGRSFVTIMVVIALCALILRFGIEKIIKVTIVQNETHASTAIKLISAALENYAKDSRGVYPANLAVLTQNKPSYLDRDYIRQSPIRGYIYTCSRLESSGYSCSAIPATCGLTGKINYSISTGSLLVSEVCEKK